MQIDKIIVIDLSVAEKLLGNRSHSFQPDTKLKLSSHPMAIISRIVPVINFSIATTALAFQVGGTLTLTQCSIPGTRKSKRRFSSSRPSSPSSSPSCRGVSWISRIWRNMSSIIASGGGSTSLYIRLN